MPDDIDALYDSVVGGAQAGPRARDHIDDLYDAVVGQSQPATPGVTNDAPQQPFASVGPMATGTMPAPSFDPRQQGGDIATAMLSNKNARVMGATVQPAPQNSPGYDMARTMIDRVAPTMPGVDRGWAGNLATGMVAGTAHGLSAAGGLARGFGLDSIGEPLSLAGQAGGAANQPPPGGSVMYNIGTAIPPTVSAVGASMLPGGAALAPLAFGGQSAGETFGRALDENRPDALPVAAGSFVLNTALGAVHVPAVLGKFPGVAQGVEKFLTTTAAKRAATFGGNVAAGSVTNLGQGMANRAYEVLSGLNPDALNNMGPDAINDLLIGAILAAPGAAVGAAQVRSSADLGASRAAPEVPPVETRSPSSPSETGESMTAPLVPPPGMEPLQTPLPDPAASANESAKLILPPVEALGHEHAMAGGAPEDLTGQPPSVRRAYERGYKAGERQRAAAAAEAIVKQQGEGVAPGDVSNVQADSLRDSSGRPGVAVDERIGPGGTAEPVAGAAPVSVEGPQRPVAREDRTARPGDNINGDIPAAIVPDEVPKAAVGEGLPAPADLPPLPAKFGDLTKPEIVALATAHGIDPNQPRAKLVTALKSVKEDLAGSLAARKETPPAKPQESAAPSEPRPPAREVPSADKAADETASGKSTAAKNLAATGDTRAREKELGELPYRQVREMANRLGIAQGATKRILVAQVSEVEARARQAESTATKEPRRILVDSDAQTGKAMAIDTATGEQVGTGNNRAELADRLRKAGDHVTIKGDESPGVGGKLTRFADKMEAEARARLKSGGIREGEPRPPEMRGARKGSTSLPSDIADFAKIVAARAIKAGVKTGAAVRRLANEAAKELGIKLTDDHLAESRRVLARAYDETAADPQPGERVSLKGVLQRATVTAREGARVDAETRDASIEATTRDVKPSPKDVRADEGAIERAMAPTAKETGKAASDAQKANRERFAQQAKERAALRTKMKAAEKASNEGFAAGVEEGKAQAAAPARESIKQRINRTTGVKDDVEPTVAEAKALRVALRREERTSNRAWFAGRKQALEQASVSIESLKSEMKQKRMTEDQLRKKVIEFVQQVVPRRDQGRFLSKVAKTTTLNGYWKAIGEAQRVGLEADMRREVRLSRKPSEISPKLTEDLRTELRAAQDQIRDLIEASKTTTTLSGMLGTAEKLRENRRLIREVIQQHRNTEEIRIAGQLHKTEEVVGDVLAKINAKEPTAKDELALTKFANPAQVYILGHTNMDTLGRVIGSEHLHKLFEDMWNGETAAAGMKHKAEDHLQSSLREAGFDPGSDDVQRLSKYVSGADVKKQAFNLPDAGKVMMTPAEAMELYAVLGDSNAGPQIRSGVGITFSRDRNAPAVKFSLADADTFVRVIDPKLRQLVDRAKAFIEKDVRPGAFKAHREQKGWDLEKIPGYWRTKRNRAHVAPTGEAVARFKGSARVLENLPFLREREGGRTPYQIGDFFETFHDMVYKGAAVAEMTGRVRSAELVLKDPRVVRALERKFGQDLNNRVDRLIEDAKLIFPDPRTRGDGLMTKLGRRLARAVITLRDTAMLKNVGGMFKLMSEFASAKHWRAGMNPLAMFSKEVEDVIKNGTFLRERYEGAAWRRVVPSKGSRGLLLGESSWVAVGKRILKGRLGAVGEMIDKIKLFDRFDKIPIRVAVAGKFAEGRAKGLEGAELRKFVERESEYAVRRTQNSSSALDMSDFSAEHRGTAMSLFAMFTSDSNKAFNQLYGAWQQRKSNPKRVLGAVAGVAMNLVWASLIDGVYRPLRDKMLGMDDKDDERTWWEKTLRSLTRNTGGMMYGGDTIADSVMGLVDIARGKNYLRTFEGPIAGTVAKGYSGLADLVKAFRDQGDWYKAGPNAGKYKAPMEAAKGLEKLLIAGSRLAGLPIEDPVKWAFRLFEKYGH